MTAVPRVPLGPGTIVGKWYLDINTNTYASPVWTPVNGVMEITPKVTSKVNEYRTADSGGFGNADVAGLDWSIDLKVTRKVTVASLTVYDTGQEALRTAAGSIGIANRVDVRWYEVTTSGPIVEAYRGYAAVTYEVAGGAVDNADEVAIKLIGQGLRNPITHPDYAAAVPTVVSISPTTGVAAGGEAAAIKGQYFTGVTAVKIGVTAVTDYQLVDDYTIAIVTPAKVAGPYTVYVTNAAGTNATGPTFTYS